MESGTNKFIYLFCLCRYESREAGDNLIFAGADLSGRARTSISCIYFLQVMTRGTAGGVHDE